MAYFQYCKNILRHGKTIKESSDRVLHHPLLYAGETVKVAPGHFRNHLMPKLLAVPNIDKFAYLISEQRKIYQPQEVEEAKVVQKTEKDEMKEYHKAATRLDNAKLVLRRFVKTEKELRTPVTKDELVAEVARQLSLCIAPENLNLPSPLSSLGKFEMPLRLPKSIPLPEGKLQWTLAVKIPKNWQKMKGKRPVNAVTP
ncbi:hypothetical protein RJ639_032677 [Escallonia herrerae]|uniref:Ribosomal protein L9 domain-containing protein n=1 Tax=Escallonia herrerae TaxID=1293975 RepID=A0AA89B992_9ASTE|nr:hypothetical protein RJ639_032677 [Escallonia herrerae]